MANRKHADQSWDEDDDERDQEPEGDEEENDEPFHDAKLPFSATVCDEPLMFLTVTWPVTVLFATEA